jgi:hypothetical protein
MRHRIRATRFWLGAFLVALLLAHTAIRADTGEVDAIKAGFILNFSKYTAWPAAALDGHDLLICGLSEQSLSGKLESLRGRRILGREIQVRVPTRPSEWTSCQVLFIAAEERHRLGMVLRVLVQAPVLTVSDAPEFAEDGGMIGLKPRAGRLRFDINQGAARRAGLVLSSQLLKLADAVLP